MSKTNRVRLSVGAGVLVALTMLLAVNVRLVPPCEESASDSQLNVCFENEGVRLSGTVYLPDGLGQFPAVVLLHGSGKQTRLDRFAQLLAESGLVVLTYDKRGVDRSGGRYCDGFNPFFGCIRSFESELYRLAGDASSAVDRLAQIPQVNPERIGLWGPSQGGWIAPVVASQNSRVAYLVQHAAPAVTHNEEDAYSRLLSQYPAERFPEAAVVESLMNSTAPGGFDPESYIKRLNIPSLWLYGGQDRSVPVAASMANLRTWRPDDPDVEVKLYPEAGHELQLAGESGRPAASIRLFWVEWVKALGK